jgi:flavin-dependent dehydrogenase
VRVLDELGALARVSAEDRATFRSIRWIGEDGTVAEAMLPGGGGVGIRRTALSSALAAAAVAAGADVRERTPARSHRRGEDEVVVATDEGEERALFLVAADGLASAIRRREALEVRPQRPFRFGLRRHFAVAPWADAVEVHFAQGVEAYVTPAGSRRVGVAFLVEEGSRAPYGKLLRRFPALAGRLSGVPFDSSLAGAGPFARSARARVADRLALLGDSAGYVDALTGEGVSLALEAASALAQVLPDALERGGAAAALAPFDRAAALRFRHYAAVARLALGVARHPALRRGVLALAARNPRAFSRVVGWAVG